MYYESSINLYSVLKGTCPNFQIEKDLLRSLYYYCGDRMYNK